MIYYGQLYANSIIILIIIASIIMVLKSLLDWLYSVISDKQKYIFNRYIDKIFVEKNSSLDIAVFDNPNYYNVLEEAERSKQALNFIVYRVIHFFGFAVSLTISFTVAFTYHYKFLPFIIIAFVLPALFNKGKYYSQLYKYDADNRTLTKKISYIANVLLSRNTSKELRMYNFKDYMLQKYTDNVNEYMKGKKRIIHTLGLYDSIFNTIPMFGVLIAMVFVTKNILNNSGQIGDFVYYMGIFVTLKDNLIGLIEDLSRLQESDYAINKFHEFMQLNSIMEDNGKLILEKINTIEFKDVFFTYPNTDKLILDNISFKITIPQKIAIVGLNGAGKTTIVKLLLRFYDVDSGEILINGVNIKKYSIISLRKIISPVFQDPVLYAMSLRMNVSLSDVSKSDDDDRIIEKLRMFGLDDISDKNNLDLDITREFNENGLVLSGGQSQKLSLARFSFQDADLYIMDEPTAALDPISEHEILRDFQKVYSDKGLIMISHRLSNVIYMDNIIVLNNGKIVEQGQHDILYNNHGLYYEMFSKQSANYINFSLHKKVILERNRFNNKNDVCKLALSLPSVIVQIIISINTIFKTAKRMLTVGDYTFITGIYSTLNSSIDDVMSSFAMFEGYSQKISDFKKYFAYDDGASPGQEEIDEIKEIEFKNVSFIYPRSNEPTLKNVSFILRKGEKTMLVGKNGAGKTTIVKLICGFYTEYEGEILINGIELRNYDITKLRNQIASVFQDFNIYSLTIRENVAFGNIENLKNDECILECLNNSTFYHESFKDGNIDIFINKEFDENGIALSGGQQQKLAIARAYMRNPRLVLMDEPNAALDPIAERELLEQFDKLYTNCMLLFISHRLSNSARMDKILVLEDGHIIEEGAHKELMQNKGEYYRMFSLQSEKYTVGK